MNFTELYNTRTWTDANKTVLHEVSGTYMIEFQNGKRYIGSTKNLFERLATHIRNLQGKHNYLWYKQAAIENNFPDRVPPNKPEYEPPIHPGDKLDKRGLRIGKRANKKAVAEWEIEKTKYDQEYNQKLMKWLDDNPGVQYVSKSYPYNHYEYELPWRYYLKFLKIFVCPCDDYREYEQELLRSIEDRSNYYNKKFN